MHRLSTRLIRYVFVVALLLQPGSSAAPPDIIIRAVDVPTAAIVGDWTREADSTAAGGFRLRNPNRGAARPSSTAASVSYFDVTFEADAGVPYHLWLRMQAHN